MARGRPRLKKEIRNVERMGFACNAGLRKHAEDAAEIAGLDLSGFIREAVEVAVKWQGIRPSTLAAAGLLGFTLPEYIADAIRRSNAEADEIRRHLKRPGEV